MAGLSSYEWEYIASIYERGVQAAIANLEKLRNEDGWWAIETAIEPLYEAVCEASAIESEQYDDDPLMWDELDNELDDEA